MVGSILHKIIDQEISNSHFPDMLKLAGLSPLHKDGDVMEKKNYRPISILSSISKIYERIVQNQIVRFIEDILYVHMCSYQKGYSTQHALLTLVERWKRVLDGHGHAGQSLLIFPSHLPQLIMGFYWQNCMHIWL